MSALKEEKLCNTVEEFIECFKNLPPLKEGETRYYEPYDKPAAAIVGIAVVTGVEGYEVTHVNIFNMTLYTIYKRPEFEKYFEMRESFFKDTNEWIKNFQKSIENKL